MNDHVKYEKKTGKRVCVDTAAKAALSAKEIRARVHKITTWRQGAEYAPHKAILLLLALAKLSAGHQRLARFKDIEKPLCSLLRQFARPRKTLGPEYPFWRLQRDDLWEVPNGQSLPRKKGHSDPLKSELRARDVVGGFPEPVYDILRRDEALVKEIETVVLNRFFTPALHEAIRTHARRQSMATVMGDRELEDLGQWEFEQMGLTCVHRLNKSAKRRDVDPSGTHHGGENMEIDYLIPIDHVCLVGEITARANNENVVAKYGRFREQFDVLRRGMGQDYLRACEALGVPQDLRRHFRNVKEFRAFYILTERDRFHVELPQYPNIVVYYRPEWQRLMEYSKAIGRFAQFPFLDAFDFPRKRGKTPLVLNHADHHLNIAEDRQIATDVGRADVYSFDADPYSLLPLARVFRRDQLVPENTAGGRYQRALRSDKLGRIRRILHSQPDFMFPNGILVVLSNDCRYRNGEGTLEIADEYGAVTVIDGQHRLFSYASDEVQKVHGKARIPVTAIKFVEASEQEVRRYSAITFVEINANQTRIPAAHIDEVNYAVLGRTTPDALAAAILLRANTRAGKPFYGLFHTAQDRAGLIKPRTVIKALGRVFNLDSINRLRASARPQNQIRRQGYEQVFEASIGDLANHAILVEKGHACVERFFSLVQKVFHHDWPERGADNQSTLVFSKVIAGFGMLLHQFISEGLNWASIKTELEAIRANLLKVRRISEYGRVLFVTGTRQLPDPTISASDDFRFLNANRSRPTPIGRIKKAQKRSS